MDEGGSKKNNRETTKEGDPYSIVSRFISDVGNVFSTSWVRCIVQAYDGYNRLILGSRRGLLLNFRIFLVGIYIAYQIYK